MITLPPVNPKELKQLEARLRRVPERLREDATQEAWVAYLEGKSTATAVKTFGQRERRHEKRQQPATQIHREQKNNHEADAGSLNINKLGPKDIKARL